MVLSSYGSRIAFIEPTTYSQNSPLSNKKYSLLSLCNNAPIGICIVQSIPVTVLCFCKWLQGVSAFLVAPLLILDLTMCKGLVYKAKRVVCRLRELELPRSAWEDKGDKVEDLGQNQTKPKTNSHSPALASTPEARNVAVVNWWKALNVEGTKNRTSRDEDSHSCQALCEARTKLQQAERTIGEMKVHLRQLQAALKTEQEHVIECQTTHVKTAPPVLYTRDEETNTDTESRTEAPPVQELVTVREVKDAAVGPDLDMDNAGKDIAERQGGVHGLTAEGLLASLRKMEAMISGALETAEGVRQSELRVSLVRERMESITQKVKEALGRAADTDLQLSALEARVLEGDQAVVGSCVPQI